MAKIVLIGAGSHTFSKHLITDVISYPELRDSTICLMDHRTGTAGFDRGFREQDRKAK